MTAISIDVKPMGGPRMVDLFYSRAMEALMRKARKEGWAFLQPSQYSSHCLTLTQAGRDGEEWSRDYVVLSNGTNHYVYRIQYLDDGIDRLKWIDRIPSRLKEYLEDGR